jgi:hypothetical protein
MNKLEKKHQRVIDNYGGDSAGEMCAIITIEFSKGFNEWFLKNVTRIHNVMFLPAGDYTLGKPKTIDELIEIYIKTL